MNIKFKLLYALFAVIMSLYIGTFMFDNTVVIDGVKVEKKLLSRNGEPLRACVSDLVLSDKISAKHVGHRLYWNSGDTIPVAFIGGTEAEKKLVEAIVEDHYGKYDIHYKWNVTLPESHVRISFMPDAGSYSYPGTYSRDGRSKGAETMNFGWLDQGTILHEWAHMLYGNHEHQHGIDPICLIDSEVYKDLAGPPNNWDHSTIERNVIYKYSVKEADMSDKRDDNSILKYPLPCNWTCSSEDCYGGSDVLSVGDDAFLTQLYGLRGEDSTTDDGSTELITHFLCQLLSNCSAYQLKSDQLYLVAKTLSKKISPETNRYKMIKIINEEMDLRGCYTCIY